MIVTNSIGLKKFIQNKKTAVALGSFDALHKGIDKFYIGQIRNHLRNIIMCGSDIISYLTIDIKHFLPCRYDIFLVLVQIIS